MIAQPKGNEQKTAKKKYLPNFLNNTPLYPDKNSIFAQNGKTMNVAEIIKNSSRTAFSFEVLPPLKGNSIDKVFDTIDALREFDPKYINITSHRSEFIYKAADNGLQDLYDHHFLVQQIQQRMVIGKEQQNYRQ